jgi:hypothetical protein
VNRANVKTIRRELISEDSLERAVPRKRTIRTSRYFAQDKPPSMLGEDRIPLSAGGPSHWRSCGDGVSIGPTVPSLASITLRIIGSGPRGTDQGMRVVPHFETRLAATVPRGGCYTPPSALSCKD